jgi:hypothetical protein
VILILLGRYVFAPPHLVHRAGLREGEDPMGRQPVIVHGTNVYLGLVLQEEAQVEDLLVKEMILTANIGGLARKHLVIPLSSVWQPVEADLSASPV